MVVVVCNGCTEATAAEAGAVPGVTDTATAKASTIATSREGDHRTDMLSRIQLDGNVPSGSARPAP